MKETGSDGMPIYTLFTSYPLREIRTLLRRFYGSEGRDRKSVKNERDQMSYRKMVRFDFSLETAIFCSLRFCDFL